MFRFGDCLVDPQTRTVLRGQELQAAEPKVFDALVFLITHRDRVITKKALLDAVWGARVVVTDGVVARTMMKARRLIGDDAEQPTIIKTVHRVGYRFVAPVEELSARAGTGAVVHRPANPVGLGDRNHRFVAVLPIRSESSNVDLAWVEFGLAAALTAMLSADKKVSVLPITQLIAVVDSHDADLDLQAVAGKLQQALGVTDVVRSVLTQPQAAELCLQYWGAGEHLAGFEGRLDGHDAMELCGRLAREIRSCVLEDVDDALFDEPEQADNHELQFARTAFAHAQQAVHTERWETARRLLRVALDLAPTDPGYRIEYANCLVRQRDPAAVEMLQESLASARNANHQLHERRALECLATHWRNVGKIDEAERLFSQALELAEAQQDKVAELSLVVSIGETLAAGGRAPVATWMLDRAGRLATALGNRVALAHIADVRGRIAVIDGDVPAALASYSEAARLCEHFGLRSAGTFSILHVAHCLLHQGCMKDAAERFRHAFDLACQSGNPVAVGRAGCHLIRYGGAWPGDVSEATEVVEHMRRRGGLKAVQGYVEFANAYVSQRQGKVEESLTMLDAAASALSSDSFGHHVVNHHVRTLIYLGLLSEAADLCDELQFRVTGRLKRHVLGMARHSQALIARANGSDEEALALLLVAIEEMPPLLARAEATLDAAWLCLDAAKPEQARAVMTRIGPIMASSVADGYAPAMLVQARLAAMDGDAAQAVALQRRYCEMFSCSAHSAAGRTLDAYQSAGAGALEIPDDVALLPSQFEFSPELTAASARRAE